MGIKWRKNIVMSIVSIGLLASAISISEARTRIANSPKINGMPVDKCVQGAGWGFADPKRCDLKRQKIVADAYCRHRGWDEAVIWGLKHMFNKHSILTYPRKNAQNKSWTQTSGADAFKFIHCDDGVQVETRTFNHPTANGLRIDACYYEGRYVMHKYCNNRTKIANIFCEQKSYDKSISQRLETHWGQHSILKIVSAGNRQWDQILGADAFNYITCEKDSS